MQFHPLLTTGVVLWILTHLFPAFMPSARGRVIKRIGEPAYKGLFSLLILASLAMIVFGWRQAAPSGLYATPPELTIPAIVLVVLGIALTVAASLPTRLRRVIRHPQLTGVLFWATGHLLLNGDSRALILFGGMALWSVLAIAGSNRRDGAWQRPTQPPLVREALLFTVAVVVVTGLVAIHPWLSGVSITGYFGR